MIVYCCGCEKLVEPRLTDGKEVYSHRKDLFDLPFWKCDKCKNFVGCHHKTKDRTRPLGCIPTPELKKERQKLHRLIDPIWQDGEMSRKDLYAYISDKIGWTYHTAKIKTVDEARSIQKIVIDKAAELEEISDREFIKRLAL